MKLSNLEILYLILHQDRLRRTLRNYYANKTLITGIFECSNCALNFGSKSKDFFWENAICNKLYESNRVFLCHSLAEKALELVEGLSNE